MIPLLEQDIAYLKGLGAQRAALLKKELGLATYEALLYHLPFRYEDRTQWHTVEKINSSMPYVQCKGYIKHCRMIFKNRKKILTALFSDESGTIPLVWFNKIGWIQQKIIPNTRYIIFGKPSRYKQTLSIIHPELKPLDSTLFEDNKYDFRPVYHTTGKLTLHYLDSKGISRLQKNALQTCEGHITENIPTALVSKYSLLPRAEALAIVHFPPNVSILQKAQRRLKFEEVFYMQLRIKQRTTWTNASTKGLVFSDTTLAKQLYERLPFSFTRAQKKALKEIYADLCKGQHMNRLLQGDVGCGKTIVAFMSMLLPIAHGSQAAFMAPTEVLAQQHYATIKEYAEKLGVNIGLLTGSTTKKERKKIHEALKQGDMQLLISTHALLEDIVQFCSLGLVVIDEQHRFGVAQRGKLWEKNEVNPPHILLMTATPIPRTLAMTFYSHLAISVIDEMPPYRQPAKTYHAYDKHRLRLFSFIKKAVKQGRQVYIVYPRIEEGKDATYKDLIDGYESICRAFPDIPVSIVHGRMKADNKQYEMNRFSKGETRIMVATTVIEVGINVPNATVMVIENAEVFGLSQLHQLRGRVTRGAETPYCILMTRDELSNNAKKRIQTMLKTNNGFEIADMDLRLRGPGNLDGVKQSGLPSFKLVDFTEDKAIIQAASKAVDELLKKDPSLLDAEHACIQKALARLEATSTNWLQIS